MQTLLHTIRIKRLHLTAPQRASSPAVNFDRLAYFNEEAQRVFNGGNPFVADTVCAKPFEQSITLGAGVHLHFILPPRLTQFSDDPNQVLKAPNRWLVRKLQNNEVTKQWVIESDFLSKEKQISDRPQSTTLFMEKGTEIGTQPFRYVGRFMTLEEYLNPTEISTGDKYWNDLLDIPFTAFAHGDTHFSTFYPSCLSVFGFYDPDGTEADSYEVTGWYDEKTPRYLTKINALLASGEDLSAIGLKRTEKFATFYKDIKTEDFTSLLFCGKSITQDYKNENIWQGLKFALGNDPDEAFSALLSKTVKEDPKEQLELERQLEALQFDNLKQQKLDLAPEFELSRHKKGFTAKRGHDVFDLQFWRTKNSKEEQAEFAIVESELIAENYCFKELREKIETLNEAITLYEKNELKIQKKQQLLYAHWQKYLQAVHPPLGLGKQMQDNNAILEFIISVVLPDLEKEMIQTGILNEKVRPDLPAVTPNENTAIISINSSTHTLGNQTTIYKVFQSIEHKIKRDKATDFLTTSTYKMPVSLFIVQTLQDINTLLEKIKNGAVLDKHFAQIGLKNVLGQTYYEPSQPSLLIASENLKAFAPKESNEDHFLLPLDYGEKSIEAHLKNCYNFTTPCTFQISEVKEQAQPLFIDWEVYFMPTETIESSHIEYDSNFIRNTFQILREDPEFSFIADTPKIERKGISRYTGRAIPGIHEGKNIKEKIEVLNALEATKPLFNQLSKKLADNGYLVNLLDGFNSTFIQEITQMQLPIGDPIAFKHYQNTYDNLNLKTFIGTERYSSPSTEFDFNPIRTGSFHLSRVAMVNTFGEQTVIELQKEQLLVPETMRSVNRHETTTDNLPHLDAFFYPRFMQSAAIRAHWMKANENKPIYSETTNDNPICGWIVPNFFTKAIAVYTADGENLGNVLMVNGTMRFEPGPYQDEFDPKKVVNNNLRNFLNHLSSLKDFKAFLRFIQECLLFIDPETAPNHNDLNYMFGRPMALARMQVDFVTRGGYQCKKDHETFQKMLQSKSAEPRTSAYENVEIPLRVGDYSKLNEGVIMYWNDADLNAAGEFDQTYSSSLLPTDQKAGTIDEKKGKELATTTEITHSLASDPKLLTLLIDPRADIHICSGVLPMKIKRLPERFWKATLSKLRINFEMGPGIFPKNEIRLNLPKANDYGWSWLQKRKDESGEMRFTEIPELPAIKQAVFEEALGGDEKLLSFTWEMLTNAKFLNPGIGGDAAYAFINYEQGTPENLGTSIELTTAFTELISQYATSINPHETEAIFTQNEMHDGWIELYETTNPTSEY